VEIFHSTIAGEVLPKITEIRKMADRLGKHDLWLEVDGGVKGSNAWRVVEACERPGSRFSSVWRQGLQSRYR